MNGFTYKVVDQYGKKIVPCETYKQCIIAFNKLTDTREKGTTWLIMTDVYGNEKVKFHN